MPTIIYSIHRAISRPMEFKGLKEQYILIAGGGLVGDLLLFILLYCCRVPSLICVFIAFGLGIGIITTCIRLSRQYGIYGLLKTRARHRVPSHIRIHSRKIFTDLKT